MGERKAWTARGAMLPMDGAVIQTVAAKNLVAARIFVTGEVHESRLGDAAVRALVSINDTLYMSGGGQEPLFIQTRDDTVRMARFDPRVVWGYFHPDVLVGLVTEEAKRLHVDIDPWEMDNFDFYEEMAAVLRKKNGDAIPVAWKDSDIDTYYNAVYLSCLLLFNKAGYLDVPVAQYFAQPQVAQWMAGAGYRKLVLAETNRLDELRKEYGKVQALTNPELNFIVGLYERHRQ